LEKLASLSHNAQAKSIHRSTEQSKPEALTHRNSEKLDKLET